MKWKLLWKEMRNWLTNHWNITIKNFDNVSNLSKDWSLKYLSQRKGGLTSNVWLANLWIKTDVEIISTTKRERERERERNVIPLPQPVYGETHIENVNCSNIMTFSTIICNILVTTIGKNYNTICETYINF